MVNATDSAAAFLADQLERSYLGGAWHGPAIREILADLTPETAVRHPVPGAHSIVELVGHLTYWLDVARLRITGGTGSGDRLEWPQPHGEPEVAWHAALAQLDHAHRSLVAAVAGLDDTRLDQAVPGSDPTVRGLLLGVLQHNAYHAGQIKLLVRASAGGKP